MQTFLPYPDFAQSARCLDYRRLGKQRVEAMQLINSLTNPHVQGWSNHPAALMWQGYVPALKHYHNVMVREWERRGYVNNMLMYGIEFVDGFLALPPWIGRKDFHDSHKSNLLRKAPEHYEQFGWSVPDNLSYVWPAAALEISVRNLTVDEADDQLSGKIVDAT